MGPLTFSGYIVRRFGYRWTFIFGLVLYGIGVCLFLFCFASSRHVFSCSALLHGDI